MRAFKSVSIVVSLLLLLSGGCSDKSTETVEPPPSRKVSINAPIDSAVICEIATVSVSVSGGNVLYVKLYFDGFSPANAKLDSMPFTYAWDVTDYADSTYHSLFARCVYSDSEVLNSDTISVLIDNSESRPQSVVLEQPDDITDSSFTLIWEASKAVDFNSYRVFTSESAGVTTQATLLATIVDNEQISLQVNHPHDNYTRFYRIFTYDVFGLFSGSNEISVTTLNISPDAPELLSASELGDNEVRLAWTMIDAHDFAKYDILRKGQYTGFESISSSSSFEDTTYIDRTVDGPGTYYFKIRVVDTGDSSAVSDEVEVWVSDPRPSISSLVSAASQTETAVQLIWNSCSDADFLRYRVFRGNDINVGEESTLIVESTSHIDTAFTDNTVFPGSTYYYRLYVWDSNGFSKASEALPVTVVDELPEPAELVSCLADADSSCCLRWSECVAVDFDYYRLCRSDQPNVSVTSPTAAVIYESTDTSYVDYPVDAAEGYYYRVFVYDLGGNASGSNEIYVQSPDCCLVAYWTFDEDESGIAFDVSGYGNHGVIHDATHVGGVVGKALQLDGNDYVEVQNAPSLNPIGAITLEAWYRPNSNGGGATPIIDKGYIQHSGPFYQYHLSSTGDLSSSGYGHAKFEFVVGVNRDDWAYTPSDFWTAGVWYHLVGTYDGQYMRLYVDGDLIDSEPATGNMQDYGKNVFLGKFSNLNQYLVGAIDEVRIYNRALSQSEVVQRFHLK
ncbi:MAG: LamG-like jellyroll fold domain-containing protein [Candidatus Zixiibacteriota bacterium]